MVMNMFRESYANKYTPPTNSYMNTLSKLDHFWHLVVSCDTTNENAHIYIKLHVCIVCTYMHTDTHVVHIILMQNIYSNT